MERIVAGTFDKPLTNTEISSLKCLHHAYMPKYGVEKGLGMHMRACVRACAYVRACVCVRGGVFTWRKG